jgi:hypothetical protein
VRRTLELQRVRSRDHDNLRVVIDLENAERRTHVFFDGGELDTQACALVKSGYVETLADAANLSFGGYMQVHRERRAFEAELDRALRR